MRFILVAVATVFISTTANAAVEDYCQAYAQDIADQVEKQNPRWQSRFDFAQKSCLFRFTNTVEKVVVAKPKPKIAAVKTSVEPASKPKPTIKPMAEPETQVAAQVAATVVPKLEVGSPEWNDYCKKKYVSFDESKGTYTSKTGIERKCLVTAE
jgi:BA14K-like protein